MQITRETDYAVRIVGCLAHNGGRMGAQAIADDCDVTLRFSLKILRKLVQTEIIRSYKGAQGGYEIGRPLDQISLNDVIVTIEGEYVFNRCLRPGMDCPRNVGDNPCVYHRHFHELSMLIRDHLSALTFDKLIAEGQRWDVPLHGKGAK